MPASRKKSFLDQIESLVRTVTTRYAGLLVIGGLIISITGSPIWLVPIIYTSIIESFPLVENWLPVILLAIAPLGWALKAAGDYFQYRNNYLPSPGAVFVSVIASAIMFALCAGMHMDVYTRQLATGATERTWKALEAQDELNYSMVDTLFQCSKFDQEINDTQGAILDHEVEVLENARATAENSRKMGEIATRTSIIAGEALEIARNSIGVDSASLPKLPEIPKLEPVPEVQPFAMPKLSIPQMPKYSPPKAIDSGLKDAILYPTRVFYLPVILSLLALAVHLRISRHVFNELAKSVAGGASSRSGRPQRPGR